MLPYIAGFDQVAYVTNDMERALERFRHLGIPRFQVDDLSFRCKIRGEAATVDMTAAFADVGPNQVEIIQPRGGACQIYSQLLPADGTFAMTLHHLRVCVPGDIEAWRRRRQEIDESKRLVALESEYRTLAFLYTDDRDTLGHFTEYVWFHPDQAVARKSRVPQYADTWT